MIDKNNLQVTSAFKELFKKLIVELPGEVSFISSGGQFPPAEKYLHKKSLKYGMFLKLAKVESNRCDLL